MLTTIDKVKEILIETTDKDDARLTSCLTRASKFIEQYTGRTFASTVYTNEMYDGTGSDTLQLRNYPLIAVSSVLEYGNALTIGTDPSTGVNIIWKADTGKLVRPYFRFLPYRAWYSVTYTAGYAAIPDDIVEVAIQMTLLMLKERERAGLAAHGTGATQSTYTRKLPEWANTTLEMYRDLALGSPS